MLWYVSLVTVKRLFTPCFVLFTREAAAALVLCRITSIGGNFFDFFVVIFALLNRLLALFVKVELFRCSSISSCAPVSSVISSLFEESGSER